VVIIAKRIGIDEWLRKYGTAHRIEPANSFEYRELRKTPLQLAKTISIWGLKGRVLVIAEKPKAGSKIAFALSKDYEKARMYGVPYYIIKKPGLTIYVASAAGHLYGLYTNLRGYPVFEYEWRPLHEVEKNAEHTRKFLEVLRKLCEEADYFVNACDYDVEGSVIGFLIILFNGDPGRSFRAKFSSLTPEELRSAFNKLTNLDYEMIEAGLCRHELDWIWGVNISRALMEAVKASTGKKVILSAGRVQTPTLKYVTENNIARNLFIPLPQFTITAYIEKDGEVIKLEYAGPVIEEKKRVEDLIALMKQKPMLIVDRYEEKTITYSPPPAFNLGDLQSEAARIYGFSPYKTQSIAEKLYLEALISYPRTNSQKLPPTLDYRGIIENLARIPAFSKLARDLLTETRGILKPVQGPKDDPAHPAIYPTGVEPSGLSRDEWKIYELIVRRFLAAFAREALVYRRFVTLKHPSNPSYLVFQASGQKVADPGWFKYYPYLELSETQLPRFHRGEVVRLVKVVPKRSYTKPPEKLSKIKILKWMEQVGIGTESTRARIIELLFKRGYLRSSGNAAEVTDLGLGVIEVLAEYFPELTSVELTRQFEEEMESIRLGLKSRLEVVEKAKKTLAMLLKKFDEHKEDIGFLLATRLKLAKPSKVCTVCGREAETLDANLCKYHSEAIKRVEEYYKEWYRREGVSWSEYLEKLSKLKSTGKWIREVLPYIYKRGVTRV